MIDPKFKEMYQLYEGSHTKNIKRIDKPIPEGDHEPVPQQDIASSKTYKTKVKSTPGHFKVDQGKDPPTNKPRTAQEGNTYEVKYAKTGSLIESLNDDWFESIYQTCN